MPAIAKADEAPKRRDDADLLDALRELTGEIRALRAALHGSGVRRLSNDDRMSLQKLLPIIYAAVLGGSFTVAELEKRAKLQVAPAVALREALASMDARRLGRLFRRGVDHQIERYCITAVGSTRDGMRWCVDCGNQSSHVTASFARRSRPASNH